MIHPIPPVFNNDSKILILGSFPSVKSRESGFFYGHPQNRFWKVIADVLGSDVPKSIEEKTQFLIENKIALWDVIAQCEIIGSADSTIANEIANDITPILESADIQAIFTNGKKAFELFNRKIKPAIGRDSIYLPSTSPANAAFSQEKLKEKWKIIIDYIED